jgi:hypothetical protein
VGGSSRVIELPALGSAEQQSNTCAFDLELDQQVGWAVVGAARLWGRVHAAGEVLPGCAAASGCITNASSSNHRPALRQQLCSSCKRSQASHPEAAALARRSRCPTPPQVVLPVLRATANMLAGDKARSAQCDVRLSVRSAGWMKEKVAGTQVGWGAAGPWAG